MFEMPDGSQSYTDTDGISWHNTRSGQVDDQGVPIEYSPEENAKAASGVYNQTASQREGERYVNQIDSAARVPTQQERDDWRSRVGNKGTGLPQDKSNAVRDINYSRNKSNAIEGGKFITRLDGDTEQNFREWAKGQGIDPKDKRAEIDWRGYYQAKQRGLDDPLVKFLTPFHRDFGQDSIYAKPQGEKITERTFGGLGTMMREAPDPFGAVAPPPKRVLDAINQSKNLSGRGVTDDVFGGSHNWYALDKAGTGRETMAQIRRDQTVAQRQVMDNYSKRSDTETHQIDAGMIEAARLDNSKKDALIDMVRKAYGLEPLASVRAKQKTAKASVR